MGNSSSSHKKSTLRSSARGPAPGAATFRFQAIQDNFTSLEQVQAALRKEGVESCNLIVAVDFTKSNEWTGMNSYGGRGLHTLGSTPNPYEEAITAIGKTLAAFDDDNLIPCYGFGDVYTQDKSVFSFNPNDQPCNGLQSVVVRYRELVSQVRLSGPTSFAPAVEHAMKIVAKSGSQYHILLIVADGQVTRSSDLPDGALSRQERQTINAIAEASKLPLSIVMVGVGDGPWEQMKEFDDALPQREFDNFQFVNFTEIQRKIPHDPQRRETLFALRALMEIPEQFRCIQRLGLLGRRVSNVPSSIPLPPPFRPATPPTAPPASRPGFSNPAPAYSSPATTTTLPSQQQAGQPAFDIPITVEVDPLFTCPITHDVMSDPVIASDGYTYDRAAIEHWLQSKGTSPMSGALLPTKNLIPNHTLRSSILEWLEKHKGAPSAPPRPAAGGASSSSSSAPPTSTTGPASAVMPPA